MEFKAGVVYFTGAGPGDPELMTLKAAELVRAADLILYAGSLVNPEVLASAKKTAEKLSTASLPLEKQIELMKNAAAAGKVIARLHTGDPSVYGSITEQIQALNKLQIPFMIIPGVTAAFAAAASLGIEYTLAEACQSLILTRSEGRTPVPSTEQLSAMASHRCSLAIYLSSGMIGKVVDQFIAADYAPETPAAIVYHASWPDEKKLIGTLADIEERAEKALITHQSLIIVSPALETARLVAPSHLYGTWQQETKIHRRPCVVITLSADSIDLGMRLTDAMPEANLLVPEKHWQPAFETEPRYQPFGFGIRQALQEAFQKYDALICIMASGIVVRELAPILRSKQVDPAVVVIDSRGKFAVSLLSGHGGGANQLAQRVAAITGGQAVITTASDVQQIPPLDTLIKQKGWQIAPGSNLTALMGALVNHEPVAAIWEEQIPEPNPLADFPMAFFKDIASVPETIHKAVIFSNKSLEAALTERFDALLLLHSRTLWLGVGCNKGTPADEIDAFCRKVVTNAGWSWSAVRGIATIPEKADEPGLIEFAKSNQFEIRIIPHEEIRAAGSMPTPSAHTLNLFGIEGVAEPCALIAAGTDHLLIQKQKSENVTAALAQEEI